MGARLLFLALIALIPLSSQAATPDPQLEQAIRQAKAVLAAQTPGNVPAGENSVSKAIGGERLGTEDDTASLAGRMFKGLAFCAGIFLVGIAIYRRSKGGSQRASGERRLSIIERVPLTAKTSLCVVRFGGREILLAVGPDRVTMQQQPAEPNRPIMLDQIYEGTCEDDIRLSA